MSLKSNFDIRHEMLNSLLHVSNLNSIISLDEVCSSYVVLKVRLFLDNYIKKLIKFSLRT